MEKLIERTIFTFICVILHLFSVKSAKKSILNEPECSIVGLNKPFINDFKLDKGGRVFIPFSLKMKEEFLLRLGTDLDVAENIDKSPCYFIRIEEHKRYQGGIQDGNGKETLLEAFSGINAKYASPVTDFKGYFVRVHARVRYTSIALYPAGNEEADPIILIRDEKRSHIRKINSLTMHASPESLIKVDCKSKLHQKCSFSTDCIVSGSICQASREGNPKCVCSVATKQEGPSKCTPFEVKIGDKCENSLICHTINAKCRKNYTTNSEEKTCQCFPKQIITDDGLCMDAPGELDWERLYRGYPSYEDLYPGKLPPEEDDGVPLRYKEGPCHADLKIDHDTSRMISIPYKKIGFDMKYILSEPLRGTIKILFYTLKERVTARLTLSSKDSNILKFGKGSKFIKNYSGELTNTVFFRVENRVGKSVMGLHDGISMYNVTKKKITDIMELPTDVGISSDFPTRIKLFCD